MCVKKKGLFSLTDTSVGIVVMSGELCGRGGLYGGARVLCIS